MTYEQAVALAFLRALDIRISNKLSLLAWYRLDCRAYPDFSLSGYRKW